MKPLLRVECVSKSFGDRRVLSSASLRAVLGEVVVTAHDVPTLLTMAGHISWCTSGTTYELAPPALATAHEAFREESLGSWFSSPVF